jgi:hypothetical protein
MNQGHPQEALYFTKDLNNEETNECGIQELLESLSEATFENIWSENYLNIDNDVRVF